MTINRFAMFIGLNRAENLYQIKKGNNGISRDLAARITAKFPEINTLWLLTGDGEMLRQTQEAGTAVSFYDGDVEADIVRLADMEPAGEMLLPMGVDCDLAMYSYSRAMAPSTPQGSVVLLKRVGPDSIIPGMEYVIIGRKIVTLRIVRAGSDGETLRLVAADRRKFDDISLKKSDITEAYRVAGKIIINN